MAFHAWLTEHDDRLRLQATIATQKQALDAADTRERDRAVTLKDTLARSAEAADANSRSGTPRSAKISFAPPAHDANSAAKRIARNPAGNCAVQNGSLRREEGLPLAGSSAAVANRDLARPRTPRARRANKPARSPRRSVRSDSRCRSEALVRLRTGLPLVPGPTRRREAKCRRQCREIDRRHART
jgi:hypothetical protein